MFIKNFNGNISTSKDSALEAVKAHFIVGIGRSGTTLLMSMLNTHPSLQATPEVNFFHFFHQAWKDKTSLSEKDLALIDQYVDAFSHRGNASGFSWNRGLFVQSVSGKSTLSFASIYKAFYSALEYGKTKKQVTHTFDKNPINTLFIGEIMQTFPEARFIYIVRDPRANFLSRKQSMKRRVANVFFDSYRWKLYNEEAIKWAERYPERIHILKYENLVSNPVAVLQQLSAFFNFPFDSSMLDFHKQVRENSLMKILEDASSLKPKTLSKYKKLSQPVNKNRVLAWQQELTPDEIQICTSICGPTALKLGYTLEPVPKKRTAFIAYSAGWLKAELDYIRRQLITRVPLCMRIKRLRYQ